jgi:hypothetical protein
VIRPGDRCRTRVKSIAGTAAETAAPREHEEGKMVTPQAALAAAHESWNAGDLDG